MDRILESALASLDVAELSREEWLNVGMALKESGYDCSVWDGWSQKDSRYKERECSRLWKGFNGHGIKAGTIVAMAKERGWESPVSGGSMELDWNSIIEYDGESLPDAASLPDKWEPITQVLRYVEALFQEGDRISIVTEALQDKDEKWKPASAGITFSHKRLTEQLRMYESTQDLGAVIGDYNKEAGVWVRFNPLDGNGVKNDNVTAFRYALVESDTMSISEQDFLYRKLELPIAMMVNSGGKSLHAIVKIEAENVEEYRKRVNFLYDFLEKNGCTVDKQNRNPARLSRLPGIERNGKKQFIVAENIGRASWSEWMDFAEGASDELPQIVGLNQYKEAPEPPPALIQGLLRMGHKMLISGPSKAGKSFLMGELALDLAYGREWLGFKCKQSKVLYINLEIDPDSFVSRFFEIKKAMGITDSTHDASIMIWNLRGKCEPMDKLVQKIIRRMKGEGYGAVIIDPIYKVLTGDENNASDMGAFCNQFDKICAETGAACVYCHHHSKGAQGSKRAMDRASGSGVFARDPDAIIDMIQLEPTDFIKAQYMDDGSTAWRIEGNLREFKNFKPVNLFFRWPLHVVDDAGILVKSPPEGSAEANLQKSGKRTDANKRYENLASAFENSRDAKSGTAKINDIASFLGISAKSVHRYVEEFSDEFLAKGSYVVRIEGEDM